MSELEKLIPPDVYAKLLEYIKTIQFGSVTLILQNGKIIQIDKNEKIRIV
jgi:hypothetical protein